MISNSSFSGLSSIRQLHLRDNMIADIVDPFIWNLRTLTHLYLDGNRLTRLPSLATGSEMLRRLSVANNNISDISEDQMRDAWRLATLNISYTLITEIDFMSAITSISDFIASSTPIMFTESFWDNETNLVSVAFSNIGLDKFPLFSASKWSIKKIDLSQNKIKCVDVQHLANMTDLLSIYINHNYIGGFPDIGCRNGINITNPWEQLQFPNLVTFHVQHNQLKNLQRDMLINMPNLQYLSASFNKIEYMPFLSAVGAALRHVNLDHNNINHIEEEHISGLSGLQSLQLSYNVITYLRVNILATVNNLQLLDLQNNKLTSTIFDARHQWWEARAKMFECRKNIDNIKSMWSKM